MTDTSTRPEEYTLRGEEEQRPHREFLSRCSGRS
jgi:hypothetical protein